MIQALREDLRIVIPLTGLLAGSCLALLFHFHVSSVRGQLLGKIEAGGPYKLRTRTSMPQWEIHHNETEVRDGDQIFTPVDSGARLVLRNHQAIELAPRTWIRVEQSLKDRPEVYVISGKARGEKDSSGIHSATPALLSHLKRGEVSARVARALDLRPEFLRTSSSVPVTPIGTPGPPAVKVTEGKTVFSQRAPPVRNTVPKLLLPQAQARIRYEGKALIKFRWEARGLEDAVYELELSRSANMARFTSVKTKHAEFAASLSKPGEYYWRIRLRDSKGAQTGVSNIQRFMLVPK